MRTPYDRYIRFLITRGKEDTDSVNNSLTELGLPEITRDEFDIHANIVLDSIPNLVRKQVENQKFEGDFLKYMSVLDLREFWLYEKEFRSEESRYIKLVYDIHQDPRLRIALNALLIKGMRKDDLCQTLNLKFSSMLRVEHVDAYEKYFWEVRRMTRTDWKRYIGKCRDFEKNVLFTCFSDDVETVKASLELPSKTSTSDMLQYLFSQSYQKAKHYLRFNSKEQNVEARAWIDQTLKLADRYEKHRTGDVEDFGKSLQMEFDFIDSDFMTPDDTMIKELKERKDQIQDGDVNT